MAGDYNVRGMRTAVIAIIVAAFAYKVLDVIAERRVEREAARLQAEWAAAAEGSAPLPGTSDPFDDGAGGEEAVQGESDCQHADWEPKHGDPLALVREYVQRDGSGQFLGESAWRSSAVACPEQLATGDGAALITKVETRAIEVGADTALIEVTYQRAGVLAQQGGESEEVSSIRFVAEPRTEVDTFVVVRDPESWRIHAPMIEQHLLPDAALRGVALAAADRQAIQALR